MTKTTVFAVLMTALFLAFPSGQANAQADCADPDLPRLECDIPDPTQPNTVRCIMIWSEDPERCYSKQPNSFDEEADETDDAARTVAPRGLADEAEEESPAPVPAWQYWWVTSDGHYRFANQDTIFHTFNDAGAYEARVRMTATYSPDEEPELRPFQGNIATDIDPADRVAYSNFSTAEDSVSQEVKVEPHWAAAVIGDTVSLAISYRNLQAFAQKGVIYLFVPPSGFPLITQWGDPPPSITEEATDPEGFKVYRWETGKVNPDEEKTFFVDFEVGEDIPLESQVEIRIGLAWDEDEPLSIDELLGYIFTPGGDQQADVPNPAYTNTSAYTSLGVNAARDPNRIAVDRRWISPSELLYTPLNYTVFFQNLGSGPARKVRVKHFIRHTLLLNSLQWPSYRKDAYFPRRRIGVTPPTLPNGSPQPEWLMEGRPGREFVLASPDMVVTDDSTETKGFIRYALKPDPILQAGDTILAHALIRMDQDSLVTDTAMTIVRELNKISIPWRFGLKAGVNGKDEPALPGPEGWHFGFTLRKPFSKLPGYYKNNRTINVGDLPEFWYQGELMVSNMRFSDSIGVDYNLWYLDIVPLQIRYAPKSISRRWFAISGGYMASYLLSGEIEGVKVDGDFGERLEHNVFIDGALINVLGSPGLSVGYRFNRRLSASVLPEDEYDLHQLYLHLNF